MDRHPNLSLTLTKDPRFKVALDLFNSADWYSAHDAFEELWHETNGPERRTLQGILQIAVAQLHLNNGNRVGATILYGESLGRLRKVGTPSLGIDLVELCNCINDRLNFLHKEEDPDTCSLPFLHQIVDDQ